MRTIHSQQEGSPNRNFCQNCGSADVYSFQEYCMTCKQRISANKEAREIAGLLKKKMEWLTKRGIKNET